MKLIAGLGNPGTEYENTRHNVGFMVLDRLLRRFRISFKETRYRSPCVTGGVKGEKVTFIKPMLYMNLSGGPVNGVMGDSAVSPADLLVIHDDVDIPFGDVRYKVGGGHGGHNGLRSIIGETGSADFCRVRVGVGRPPEGVAVTDHVLGEFGPEDSDVLGESIDKAVKLVESRFLLMYGK
ncbi:Peptidyl-tRNA hydrolase [hydrothermal vent metagenome]|uniref:peptidyl-tRNA hydrolase n=1 Tax=hydrothermal vent metagenome TaxID=652676 RepID=A0A3B1CUL6_9ZZZZ